MNFPDSKQYCYTVNNNAVSILNTTGFWSPYCIFLNLILFFLSLAYLHCYFELYIQGEGHRLLLSCDICHLSDIPQSYVSNLNTRIHTHVKRLYTGYPCLAPIVIHPFLGLTILCPCLVLARHISTASASVWQ